MTMCAKALLGDPLPTPLVESLNPGAISTIQRVVNHQVPYWSALQFHVDLPRGDVLPPQEIPLSIEEQLEKLHLDGTNRADATNVIEILEASGVTELIPESSTEPKTLQEFLLLPENVDVMFTGKSDIMWIERMYFLNRRWKKANYLPFLPYLGVLIWRNTFELEMITLVGVSKSLALVVETSQKIGSAYPAIKYVRCNYK